MNYNDAIFEIPIESNDYKENSNLICKYIKNIINNRIKNKTNKIIINTNLKNGLPLENINKIIGPIIEAWCGDVFFDVKNNLNNIYNITNVETQQRLSISDIIVQFKINNINYMCNIDVKTTANDILNSGKKPNITSFSRIRSEYIKDPNFLFIILNVQYKTYSTKNKNTNLIDGIIEIMSAYVYDLKFVSDNDIKYNPALGTGQIQIKDIKNIKHQERTTYEFCKLLDNKYLKSTKKSIDDWLKEARRHKWIKN